MIMFNKVPYTWLRPLLGLFLLAAGLGFPAVLSFLLYNALQIDCVVNVENLSL